MEDFFVPFSPTNYFCECQNSNTGNCHNKVPCLSKWQQMLRKVFKNWEAQNDAANGFQFLTIEM